ncbi:hypothetical protein WG66_006841 [Moniliophthora roreri]|nr:hypothetical protein WG66_006841 [Moniliophthora roreri]
MPATADINFASSYCLNPSLEAWNSLPPFDNEPRVHDETLKPHVPSTRNAAVGIQSAHKWSLRPLKTYPVHSTIVEESTSELKVKTVIGGETWYNYRSQGGFTRGVEVGRTWLWILGWKGTSADQHHDKGVYCDKDSESANGGAQRPGSSRS